MGFGLGFSRGVQVVGGACLAVRGDKLEDSRVHGAKPQPRPQSGRRSGFKGRGGLGFRV